MYIYIFSFQREGSVKIWQHGPEVKFRNYHQSDRSSIPFDTTTPTTPKTFNKN